MDPATLCKGFFAIGTAVDLGGTLLPAFRKNVMDYGSRSEKPSDSKPPQNQDALTRLIEKIAEFQVPHSYFTHYYLVSVGSSIFWGHQIFTKGRVLKLLVAGSQGKRGMTANQVLLAWALMSTHGSRRLYESSRITKPGKSKMWVGLWLMYVMYFLTYEGPLTLLLVDLLTTLPWEFRSGLKAVVSRYVTRFPLISNSLSCVE
jgi:3-oxo-5-alpha-steroid 4-dehydrogenase 3